MPSDQSSRASGTQHPWQPTLAVIGLVWGAMGCNGETSSGAADTRGQTAGAVQIAAGDGHSCALLAGGTVKCWGDNIHGQLGDGTATDKPTPVLVRGLSGAVQITAGGLHSCALLAGGTVQCWGDNIRGQLGDGTNTGISIPVAVQGLTGAVQIAAGGLHSCALLEGGTIACWGSNGGGQLGDGTNSGTACDNGLDSCRFTPVVVQGLSGAVGIEAGWKHSCALLEAGTARCWGYNSLGQLGDGTTTGVPCADTYSCRLTPVEVQGLSGAVQITAGWNHSCALLEGGTARCWGYNSYGQLGDGTTAVSSTPVDVQGLSGAVEIAGGGAGHSCARSEGGTVKCWGDNRRGQLGDSASIGTCSGDPCSLTPIDVQGLSGAVRIATGLVHSCALLGGDTGKCWGYNSDGQLGDGTTTDSSTPVSVTGLP